MSQKYGIFLNVTECCAKKLCKRDFPRAMIARYCDFSQITSGELDKIGIFVLADSCVAVFVVAWRGVAWYNCTIMRFGVGRKTLMVVAGIVWTVAGVNILRIGIDCWAQVSGGFVLMLLGAVAVFAAFHYMVFSRMFHKHKRRISQKGDSNCLMGFFDARGWIIMAFMITLGVSIRRYELMPLWFIAPFYTGLSSALVLTGIRFLFSSKFWNRKSVG